MNMVGKLPLLAEAVLLALLLWMLSTWLLSSNEHAALMTQVVDDIQHVDESMIDLAALTSAALFGQPPIQHVQKKPAPVQKRELLLAPLNIRLVGTVVAGDRSAAIVLLATDIEQKTVFIGDLLELGVTLLHVDAEAIVVQRSGRKEMISLEQNEQLKSSMMPASALSAAIGIGRIQASENHAEFNMPLNAVPPQHTNPQMENPNDKMRTQPAASAMSRLLTQAQIEPHTVDDKQDGMLISNIVFGSLFQQVGLYNGDIIHAVNGHVLRHAQQSMVLFRELQQSEAVNLDITRAGKHQQLHYDVR